MCNIMFGTEFQIPKESAVNRLIADVGWGSLLYIFFIFLWFGEHGSYSVSLCLFIMVSALRSSLLLGIGAYQGL